MKQPDPLPPAQPLTLQLETFVPYQLSVLSNRVSQAISAEYYRRFGLVMTEWRTMCVLGRYPGLSAGEVAEQGCEPAGPGQAVAVEEGDDRAGGGGQAGVAGAGDAGSRLADVDQGPGRPWA